jgi:hypothetical protein
MAELERVIERPPALGIAADEVRCAAVRQQHVHSLCLAPQAGCMERPEGGDEASSTAEEHCLNEHCQQAWLTSDPDRPVRQLLRQL